MNKTLPLLAALALVSSAAAADLRIYSAFGEVRENQTLAVNTLEKRLPLEALSNLVPGTLTLEGVKVLSQTQTASTPKSWLEAFEGKTVFLREGDKLTEVRLIRAADGTVQDVKTGRFRVGVSVAQLEFPTLPGVQEEGGATVRFVVERPGPATLSYLTRALSWSPRYTLTVAGSGAAALESLADIRNGSSEALKVDSSELIAGTVNLTGEGIPVPLPQARFQAQDGLAQAAPATPPSIGAGSEGAGVYAYALSNAFTLPANSIYSLPFLTPKVVLTRVARLETYFNPNFSRGKLSRLYRLKSDVLLPAGNVTVRDEGRLVGQARISDVAAQEEATLNLGADPDVSFTRAVRTLTQTKQGATYQVTLTLQNAKKREVAFEVLERLDGKVELSGQAERINEGVSIRGTLPAGGKLERVYTLKYTFQQ